MVDQWNNCYEGGWTKLIVKEAFSHPAKFSRGLILKIYNHAQEMGWIKPGDVVIDPFGGVALGAFYSGKFGLFWVGIELEEKFVKLGKENIKLWEAEDRAMIIQGDSRKLIKLLHPAPIKLREADLVVSSPPFTEQGKFCTYNETKGFHSYDENESKSRMKRDYTDGKTEGNLGSMKEGDVDVVISSPPFMAAQEGGGINKEGYKSRPDLGPDWVGERTYNKKMTGNTEGQLGAMKEGNIDLVVSSPPYAGSLSAKEDGIDWTKVDNGKGGFRDMTKEPYQKIRKKMGKEYGTTEGQLGSMKEGDVDLVVSSPPYGETGAGKQGTNQRKASTPSFKFSEEKGDKYGESEGQLGNMKEGDVDLVMSSPPYDALGVNIKGHGIKGANVEKDENYSNASYINSVGNLGNSSGDTFWEAAKEIVNQCYGVLKPDGHAIWVCKDYVKNRERVPFSDRWQKLCESVGFKLTCRHHAMLVKKQKGLIMETKKERKSFFRRLAEKKGSPAIDYEDIICMEKPRETCLIKENTKEE
jgi:hypothetical protein